MGINDIIQIGNRIKELRKSKGFSQKEMAELIGVNRSTYSNYENNNREPNVDTLTKIASVLDINVADLIPTNTQLKSTILYDPEKIISAIEKTMQSADPFHSIRKDAEMSDLQIAFEKSFKNDEPYEKWGKYVPWAKDSIPEIFRPIMLALEFPHIVDMGDDDILKMLYSDEFRSFMNLLMIKYDTSKKDSDN